MEKQLFYTDKARTIRVFISSTFKDLEEERDYLAKKIFPELKKYCKERNVCFTEIDLRWGITEEEKKEQVIDACLREIERTRPYFIGILGSRYGWVPDKNICSEELRENYRWLQHDIENALSITEIEIQYGVLRNPQMIKNAFFYFRNIKEEIEPRLETLKKKITESGSTTKQFSDKHKLGKCILADLKKVIDDNFPLITKSPIEKMREEHAAFAKGRLFPTIVYIPNENNYQVLNQHIDSENSPLVISGTSGSGKSALLANWLANFSKENQDTFVFYHFVGSSAESTNYENILWRLVTEIKQQFDIRMDIPDHIDKLVKILPDFIAETGSRGKWILVIDALNQLNDNEYAKLLNWLPKYFPPFVRVVLSCTTGEMLDTLKQREYARIELPELGSLEQKQFINKYLQLFGKRLSDIAVENISGVKLFSNPLVLKTLLDELRVFGYHERLQEQVSYYTSAQNIEDFFNKVLQRLEKDYNTDDIKITKEILSLICLSSRGLLETELLEITGISPVYWSQLYNAIEPFLISYNGLLNFTHDFFRIAVRKQYLTNNKEDKRYRLLLINYFEKDKFSIRAISELPLLYHTFKLIGQLCEYITHPDVFFNIDRNILTIYFNKIIENKKVNIGATISLHVQAINNYPIEIYSRYITSLFDFLSSIDLNYEIIEICEEHLKFILLHEMDVSSTDNASIYSYLFQESMLVQESDKRMLICNLFETLADKYRIINEIAKSESCSRHMMQLIPKEYDDKYYKLEIQLKLADITSSSKIVRSVNNTLNCISIISSYRHIILYKKIGSLYSYLDKKQKAEHAFLKYLDLSKEYLQTTDLIDATLTLAKFYSDHNNPKSTKYCQSSIDLLMTIKLQEISYEKAIEIMSSINSYAKIDSCNDLTIVNCIERFLEYLKSKDNETTIESYIVIAQLYFNNKNYEASQKYLNKSRTLIENLFGINDRKIIDVNILETKLLIELQNEKQGPQLLKTAFKINLLHSGNDLRYMNSSLELGEAFFILKDYDYALKCFQIAETIADKLNQLQLYPIYERIIMIYDYQKNNDLIKVYKRKLWRCPKEKLSESQEIMILIIFMLIWLLLPLFSVISGGIDNMIGGLGILPSFILLRIVIGYLFPKTTEKFQRKQVNKLFWISLVISIIFLFIIVAIL